MIDKLGYIVCTRHESLYPGLTLFWGKSFSGYSSNLEYAGLYTKKEWFEYSNGKSEDYWIPQEQIKYKVMRVVDKEHTAKPEENQQTIKVKDMKHYILKGKEIEECNLIEWGEWLENSKNKILKQETINGTFISTVFLGINHGYCGELILFETMVRDENEEIQEMRRYGTYDEAMMGHEEEKLKINNKEDK